ncbi:hypothetical protein JW868_00340 [Candidatus Woesearchaeota archaeon]|nr:hypothetical protein [Candidatus Woesearchaeota archaeon]
MVISSKRIIVLLVFVLVVFSSLVSARGLVVSNSNDWKDHYLSVIYAGMNDYQFLHFSSLMDAELKTKTIPKGETVYVHESTSKPVVKNFDSFAEVDGYEDINVLRYKDYTELQNELFGNKDYAGYILFDPSSGIEPVVLSSFLFDNNYAPLFVTEQNWDNVRSIIAGNDNIIVAGHFPIRFAKDLPGEKYTDYSDENAIVLTKMLFDSIDNEWGIITRMDAIDLNTLKQKLPIFVYYGDKEATAELMAESGIENFEVIGGGTANIAKELEELSKKNLKMLLRYGRTMTNVEGMEGKILDLDSVYFDFPFSQMNIDKVVYYSNMKILAITFKSTGNIDTEFFTNVEFSGNPLADLNLHKIKPGSTITIPYEVPATTDDIVRTVVNTKFNYKQPLRYSILSDEGLSLVIAQAEQSTHKEQTTIVLEQAKFNEGREEIQVKASNPQNQDIVAFAEILFDDEEVLASNTITIPANSQGILTVPALYTETSRIIDTPKTIILYYGQADTLLTQSTPEVQIEYTRGNMLIGSILSFGAENSIVIIIILAVVVAGIFGFRILSKKKKKRGPGIPPPI